MADVANTIELEIGKKELHRDNYAKTALRKDPNNTSNKSNTKNTTPHKTTNTKAPPGLPPRHRT